MPPVPAEDPGPTHFLLQVQHPACERPFSSACAELLGCVTFRSKTYPCDPHQVVVYITCQHPGRCSISSRSSQGIAYHQRASKTECTGTYRACMAQSTPHTLHCTACDTRDAEANTGESMRRRGSSAGTASSCATGRTFWRCRRPGPGSARPAGASATAPSTASTGTLYRRAIAEGALLPETLHVTHNSRPDGPKERPLLHPQQPSLYMHPLPPSHCRGCALARAPACHTSLSAQWDAHSGRGRRVSWRACCPHHLVQTAENTLWHQPFRGGLAVRVDPLKRALVHRSDQSRQCFEQLNCKHSSVIRYGSLRQAADRQCCW